MINIKDLKNIDSLSVNRLPKIPREKVSYDRSDYLAGLKNTFEKALIKAFGADMNCVYVLWIDEELAYIGQSKFLFKRLQIHRKKINYTHVSIMNLSYEKLMHAVEQHLIEKHRPRLNKRYNPNYCEKQPNQYTQRLNKK